jgi:hypothetical protein
METMGMTDKQLGLLLRMLKKEIMEATEQETKEQSDKKLESVLEIIQQTLED